MRTRTGSPVLSGLFGLLSIVLLPIALVALWVSVMLTRTDVFVQEVRPLISTPGVQNALAEGVVDGVLSQVELTPAAQQLVEPLVREAATSVIQTPQMETVWEGSMANLHEEFTAVMEGREPAGLDSEGRVVLEVPIALPALAGSLAPLGVVLDSALTPVVNIPVVYADDLQRTRFVYSVLTGAGVWSAIAVVALGLLAVALAARRRVAAMLVGTGWGLAALALGLGVVAARQPALDQVPDPTVRAITNAVYGMAQRGLITEIGVVLAVAVVLLLVLAVTRIGRRRA